MSLPPDGQQSIRLNGLASCPAADAACAEADPSYAGLQYKIGPDPSSIDSCMVGGMVSNNSSGMCCGVAQNTYHTLKDMRVVLADGSVLDTSDAASRQAFLEVLPRPAVWFAVRTCLLADASA